MRIPFRNSDVLDGVAAEFLKAHHPTRQLPIPIEEIIDVLMGIHISPLDGIRRRYDVDAFTSTDMTTIFVDASEYGVAGNRFRFSLAHEVAHILLHGDFIRSRRYRTVDEYKRAQEDLTQQEYDRLELQANAVAGAILVPADLLASRSKAILAELAQEDAGLEAHERLAVVEMRLSRVFKVSTNVISRRIRDEEIPI